MEYMTALDASRKWSISRRRVVTLCMTGRIEGAQKLGSYWVIPIDAEKPADERIKTGNYIKNKAKDV